MNEYNWDNYCTLNRTIGLDYFENGPRTIMVSARVKDGTGKNKNIMKFVVHNINQLVEKIDMLKVYLPTLDDEFRVYYSVNQRNELRAYSEFKKQLCELDDMLINGEERYFGINAKWFSALSRNKVKSEHNFFFLDLDDKTKLHEVYKIFDECTINVEGNLPTKNGYHIFFHPCDTRVLMECLKDIDCELKRDALTLLGYVK